MFVNDTELTGATLDIAVQALKGAPLGPVSIGVCKPRNIDVSYSNFDQVGRSHFCNQTKNLRLLPSDVVCLDSRLFRKLKIYNCQIDNHGELYRQT